MNSELLSMGGARNLKLGERGQGPGHREVAIHSRCTQGATFFFCAGQMLIIFSCCVYGEDIAGSKGRAPGQGVRGKAS